MKKYLRISSVVALAFILIAVSLKPSTVQAQLTLGQIVGNSDKGVETKYRNVADAIVLFQRGNGPAALNMLRTAKQQNAELPPGEIMFAHLCFASGNAKPGREILQVAAVEAQNDPEVWNMLADLQLREGHFAEADLLFSKAIDVANQFKGNDKRRDAQLINAYAGAAMTNERRSQWELAEYYLRAWIKLAPKTAEVYPRLAATLINTNRFDEAMKVLQVLRKLDPNQLPAEITLGMTYQRLGKAEEAKKSMLAGLEKNANDFATQIAVARWSLGVGDIDRARTCATAALALQKDSHLPALVNAQADYLQGKFAEAEASFQKVYQDQPANYDAINGLALSMLAQNDATKNKLALQYAELIAKSNSDLRTPRGIQAAGLLSWALFHNDKKEEAVKLMVTIITNSSVSSETGYFAAVLFADQGRKDVAKELLTKSLASPSTFAYRNAAKQLLESIK